MAIDLPPVMPPKSASAAEIQSIRASRAIETQINGVAVKVYGNQYLSDAELREVLTASKTPAEAVVNLAKRYYTDGHLLVQVNYARMVDAVAILVSQKTLKQVAGDPDITPYFSGIENDSDLKIDEFHTAHVLADLRAERAGDTYSISYEDQGADAVNMIFTRSDATDHDGTDLILEANNKGSRFLGRYFGLAGVKHQFDNGTQAQLAYQTAFTELGESRDGTELNQYTFNIDHPFTSGLYGFDITYTDYQREPRVDSSTPATCIDLPLPLPLPPLCTPAQTTSQTVELEAEILQASLRGEQVLYSSPWKRITLNERIEYVDSTLERNDTGEVILDENYYVGELGGKYIQTWYQSEERDAARLTAELKLRAGFGDGGTLDDYDNYLSQFSDPALAPDVVAQARNAEFFALLPSVSYQQRITPEFTATAKVRGQFADEQLPQQQQFVLGGMDGLSAYLPGALLGDLGYLATLSIETGFDGAGLRFSPTAFLEYGSAWFNNTRSDLGDAQSVADAGLKLSVTHGKNFLSEIATALPVYDDVADPQQLENLEVKFYWRVRLTF